MKGKSAGNFDVVVIGGGIAGLAAAIALARGGREVVVAEQAGRFETAGAGLQLGPNAVRALEAIGAWRAVAPHAIAPEAIAIHDGMSGRLLRRLPLGKTFEQRFGAPYRVVHRADLLGGLLDTARSHQRITLRTGLRLEHLDIASTASRCRFDDGTTLQANAVIGADGVRSAVRAALLADGPPRSQGQIIFRALAPRPADSALDVRIWLCQGGHVVAYPVSGGARLNLVAATTADWRGEGWSAPADPREVRAAFDEAAAPLKALLAAAPVWQKWHAADRDPVADWSRGNTLLIGDAAHPTLPYLAQGAAMALEDAAVLGRLADGVARLADIYGLFQTRRRERTARLTLTSRRQGRIDHMSGAVRHMRNLAIQALPADAHLARLKWIYDWKP